MPVSMTKRSMDYLRDLGWYVASVEQWITFPDKATGRMTRIKRDAFNFADLIAIHPKQKGTLYVQTTSRANQAARRVKIMQAEAVDVILEAGNAIHVHGWAKGGARGQRKLWNVSIFEAKLESSGVNFYPILDRHE